jgi:hypothetical protein
MLGVRVKGHTEVWTGLTLHMCVTGLAKLEYRPEAEFMRLFVAACFANRFEGFNPQDLANVINGELVCTTGARIDCRSERRDTLRGRPGEAGVQARSKLHEAVRGGVHGESFRGL